MEDFNYLSKNSIYLDSACQSLRPRSVIDSLNNYYLEHNSCGERVKYKWGTITDQKVLATRQKILKYLKLKPKDYFVSFTLNTTYGINLLLSQLNPQKAHLERIITSEIEHNSPFLATMSFAHKHQLPRLVIPREQDGSINLKHLQPNSLLVVNCASNVDGRRLSNLKEVVKTIHETGGIVIIDAAQAMAHSSDILQKTEADAICFSAHKMYAPSLGGMTVRKTLLPFIDTTFIGGGMVDDVELESYQLSADNPQHVYTKFESGLQAWGEIIALGTAIDWLDSISKKQKSQFKARTDQLFEFLSSHPKIHLLNTAPSTTLSFYVDGIDSHLLGAALGEEGIMVRTGYFCVHYYLDHVLHLPPLVRLSLGYHNSDADINAVIASLSRLN